MANFMNAELEAIRDNLECGHCKARFKGSDSQARKVKYEKQTVYCSATCRAAASSQRARDQAVREGKKPRKGVLAGPCKTCGKMFESRIDKLYCSMDCYTASDQFKKMLEENREKIMPKERRVGTTEPCPECGDPVYSTKHKKRKFCSTGCYRSYLSKRFDRWIASPEGMALPQCYDEFLDREELACVVDGCTWKGQHLTLHMNFAHGVMAAEFKRAAGFNISTGVIAKPLAEAYREREVVGVAAQPNEAALKLAHAALAASPIRYKSKEGLEHAKKSRALLGVGPERTCAGCGKTFQQSTPMGKALYCSRECRNNIYAKKRRVKLTDAKSKQVA